MTITVLTIGSDAYTSYASEAEADIYLAADPVRKAAWEALAAGDPREILLVAGTRRLDFLSWKGEKTGGAAQVNAWPRTGVQYPDGTAVSTSEVPQEIEDATILLAGTINITPTVSQAGSSGSNRKRLKAGPAEIEFFRPTAGKPLQDESAFDLINIFLEAETTSASLGPLATGTDGESEFCDQDKYGRTRGFS